MYAWITAKWNEKQSLSQELERRADDLARASAALATLEKTNDARQNERRRIAAKMTALEANACRLEENVGALKRHNTELEVQLTVAKQTC